MLDRFMLNNKSILITGATGSFGKAFVKTILKKYPKIKKIVLFSRDELKQFELQRDLDPLKIKCLRFFLGDIRDKDRLMIAFRGIDIVVHAAALKQVPSCEFFPLEAVKTNILGTENVLNAAEIYDIKKVVILSTDKAAYPINAMGMSKALMEKVMIAKSRMLNNNKSVFCGTRYGNVMGSRGSVIPFFLKLSKKDKVPITDINMTRFMISLKEAIDLVWFAFQDMSGGEIYVKKIPSMKVTEIAKAINEKSKFKIIGIRPGEKIHEQMIGSDDSSSTYEYKSFYKIFPNSSKLTKKIVKKGKKVKQSFQYSSNTNKEWMTTKDLKQWIKNNKKSFLEI